MRKKNEKENMVGLHYIRARSLSFGRARARSLSIRPSLPPALISLSLSRCLSRSLSNAKA